MADTAPLYLVADLTVRDPDKLRRYLGEVRPLMERAGGQILGFSAAGLRVLEGDWEPQLLVVHRWRSQADFDAFWTSAEYQPIKALRHEACDARIAVFEAAGGD